MTSWASPGMAHTQKQSMTTTERRQSTFSGRVTVIVSSSRSIGEVFMIPRHHIAIIAILVISPLAIHSAFHDPASTAHATPIAPLLENA
jgi:hypothetical protein